MSRFIPYHSETPHRSAPAESILIGETLTVRPDGLMSGRVTSLPDRMQSAILQYMWTRYRTEIHIGGRRYNKLYSIICHDANLYPQMKRRGMTIFHSFVDFNLRVNGRQYHRHFDTVEEAYMALRVLYNLFEGKSLDDGL